MKCVYTFSIVSSLVWNEDINFQQGDLKFTLKGEKGRFRKIVVERNGVKFDGFSQVIHDPGEKIPRIHIATDPSRHFVVAQLRGIQAALAIYGVQEIDIHHPESSWVPETKEEEENNHILGFTIGNVPYAERKSSAFPENIILRAIAARERFFPLEIAFDFQRRGQEDIYYQRYIEAIYDFYFVIEFLFSDGQSSKSGTVCAFLANPEAVAALVEAVQNPDFQIREEPKLLADFQAKYGSKSPKEIFETMVLTRGFLHHQALKRKKNWNLSVQSEFKVDALFFMSVAYHAVSKIATDILFDPVEIAAFNKISFYLPGGKINWVPTP